MGIRPVGRGLLTLDRREEGVFVRLVGGRMWVTVSPVEWD